ncbi:MAG: SurA N-terminal domain-containing protein, partial [Pseudomonadota bacterium]|nr:SurA N-terminal domain-containing protein [Pseudomonadota bacterium]
EKILSEFIGKKVMALEIEKLGISINDNALRNIIKNDKIFFKDEKFSRIEYEKFLLKSGVSAPIFEANIIEQEKRRQFLSSLSGGIVIPEVLINQEFRKENQIKSIKYIDLNVYHSKNKPSETDKKELYEKNKNIFVTKFKNLRFAEITPQKISGNKEYDERFFKQLDIIENNVLDGQSFDETAQGDNLEIINIRKINANKEDENKNKITNLSNDLFKKIYNLNSVNKPEVININNKYYIAEISKIEDEARTFDDPDVQKALNAQLNFKNKIESNTSILKDISMGALDKTKFDEFASKNKLDIKNYTLKSLKQNEIFSESIIRRIFLTKDGEIDLITNNTLTKNFLIYVINTKHKDLKKGSNEYEQYEAKARLNLINRIYQSHDNNLNEKYEVELNQRTIERIKNSF